MGSIAGRCHQTPGTRGGDRAKWRVIQAKWPYGSQGAATDGSRGAPGATPAAPRCLMLAIPNRLPSRIHQRMRAMPLCGVVGGALALIASVVALLTGGADTA